MTTEDDKQLRQVLRKAHQLPEPTWNLIARATKRWSLDNVLKTSKLKIAPTSTPSNVQRFLYDVQADEKARQGSKK